MRTVLSVLVLVGVLLLTVAEPLRPTASVTGPEVLGPATPLAIAVHDRGWGLAAVDVALHPQGGGTPIPLAHEAFARSIGVGSGVRDTTLTVRPDAAGGKLPEGPAALEVRARDWSWLNLFRDDLVLRHPVRLDLTPPRVEVLTSQHRVRVGGSEAVVYRVTDDAVDSGVAVGETVFPGTAGYLKDATLRVALFAIPHDQGEALPSVYAVDGAGNRVTASLDVRVMPTRFADKTLELTPAFLQKKVPELLATNDMPPARDLVEGYLRINGELRRRTEARVRELCRARTTTRNWSDGLMRLPNAAPLAGFGDRRTYRYENRDIDRATHLGFDLASLQAAVVPAAAAGTVVFAGALGIYGNTVIVDHGLGLYTLYGHLRQFDVKARDAVTRGQPLGRTGETGLAGGDHLHFSTMIGGVHVDPIEWWDGHWIHDHALARFEPYEGATRTS